MWDAMFIKEQIDLGAFVIRAKMLSDESVMRFMKALSGEHPISEADGDFVELASNKARTKRIHRQTLLVHQ
jgi:hypothetical protein